MWAGIAAMTQGNRLVDVSRAIETLHPPPAAPGGGKYGIIEDYGGHGIGTEMHMDPHLLNYVDRERGKGPKLVPGLVPGDRADGDPRHAAHPGAGRRLDRHHDDGTWSSHWEHSVALTEDGPLVLTAPDGGRAKLAERDHGRAGPAGLMHGSPPPPPGPSGSAVPVPAGPEGRPVAPVGPFVAAGESGLRISGWADSPIRLSGA